MPDVLWHPAADARRITRLGQFADRCEQRSGLRFDSYRDLQAWSVGDGLEAMWAEVWDYFEIAASVGYDSALSAGANGELMPGARWFAGARLNYADQIMRWVATQPDRPAIVGISQTRPRIEWSWAQFGAVVNNVRTGLSALGVGPGDRVAAYLPNVPEAVAAFVATASLGATWTSCAPEFGAGAVLDRFTQIEPKVLLAVDGYRYGRHALDRRDVVAEIRAGLASVQHTVVLRCLDPATDPAADLPGGAIDWHAAFPAAATAVAPGAPAASVQVAPDHPLYVLYSSGTTGLPKAIVHGHGGLLVEHLKALGLHGDMGCDDVFFWFTTTGWMMWNYLVGGLLVGATIVTYDGDPNAEGASTLWQLAAAERVSWFGCGAPYITHCVKAGISPGAEFDLSALRAVGTTGAPLPPEGFRWVYEHVAADVMLSPISGGTDVCSAFVGGSPLTPVWEGEIPAIYLGCAVESHDGELVIRRPMPSMPVGFWGDPDGSRYRAAYFAQIPGVWRHGDWITITERGSCVISGRSDATLNRGGVRIGTAEIYRAVEAVTGVIDSLVVHLETDLRTPDRSEPNRPNPEGRDPGLRDPDRPDSEGRDPEQSDPGLRDPDRPDSEGRELEQSDPGLRELEQSDPGLRDPGLRESERLETDLRTPDPPDPGRPDSDLLVLLVVLDGGRVLDAETAAAIRTACRTALSPRHVPDEIHQVRAIPTTLSGKKLELPVRNVLAGADPDSVASAGALRDPAALAEIALLAQRRAATGTAPPS